MSFSTAQYKKNPTHLGKTPPVPQRDYEQEFETCTTFIVSNIFH